MQLNKCWLSSGVLSTLLVTLIAQARATEAGDISQVVGAPKLDVSIFADDTGKKEAERHQYNAEVARLLKIITNSVYSDSKAFVREVISNSLDAIEKLHDMRLASASQQDEGSLDDISNYKVTVEVDKENGILSFTDDGVGMTRDEMKTFLGTIAKSGTAEYSAKGGKAPADANSLIGQFGVGFYSVLLVAEKVAVISKSDKDDKQWIWETDASASYHISEDPKGNTLGRGTRVLLKIKPDSKDYLSEDKLEGIIKEFFGYDRHRIYLVKPKTITEEVPIEKEEESSAKNEEEDKEENDVEVGDDEKKEEKEAKPTTKKITKTIYEEVLMSQNSKPVWQRNPADVKPAEYESLYKMISNDKSGKALAHTHFSSETAESTYRAVLFIPERPPFNPFTGQAEAQKLDLKLHVRGVFVTAKFDDFVPKYFSYIKGIIDSDDISLNISREILQNTAELRGIFKKVIKKIIEMMTDLQSDEEKYKKFYESYSAFIKLQIAETEDYRSLLSKLLRYKTTTSGEKEHSLEQYLEAMPEAQKTKKVIYYLAGQPEEVAKSPFLGRFKEKGYEVILMTEPVDEHVIQRMDEYDGFKFTNIAKEGIKLDDDEEKEVKEFDEKYKSAKEWIGKALKDSVEKVIFASGPANVPGSLKSSQYGWTGNMERLISAQTSSKQDPMMAFFAKQKKILELNPKNALIQEILNRANLEKVNEEKELKTILRTLTDAMMIWSGYSVRDTSKFALNIERMTRKALNMSMEDVPSEKEEEASEPSKDTSEFNSILDEEFGKDFVNKMGSASKGEDEEESKDEL